MTTAHPKKSKYCVFCNRWDGDAKLTLVNSSVGFKFVPNVFGKCAIKNAQRPASFTGSTCKDYSPSREAEKLL